MKRKLNDFLSKKVSYRCFDIGEIADVYIDTLFWRIRFLSIRLSDEEIIIPVESLGKITFSETDEIFIDLPKYQLRDSSLSDINHLTLNPREHLSFEDIKAKKILNAEDALIGIRPKVQFQQILSHPAGTNRFILCWKDLRDHQINTENHQWVLRDGSFDDESLFVSGFDFCTNTTEDELRLTV